MDFNLLKPACVFYKTYASYSRCTLKETQDGIEHFNSYTPPKNKTFRIKWEYDFSQLPECHIIKSEQQNNSILKQQCAECARSLAYKEQCEEQRIVKMLEEKSL